MLPLPKSQIQEILLESRIDADVASIDFDSEVQASPAGSIAGYWIVPDFRDASGPGCPCESRVEGLVNLRPAGAFDADSACGQNIGWTAFERSDPSVPGYAVCRSSNPLETFFTIFVC